MSKEMVKATCAACDSVFKIVFDAGMSSGYPKFCPFCGTECFDDELENREEEEE